MNEFWSSSQILRTAQNWLIERTRKRYESPFQDFTNQPVEV